MVSEICNLDGMQADVSVQLVSSWLHIFSDLHRSGELMCCHMLG